MKKSANAHKIEPLHGLQIELRSITVGDFVKNFTPFKDQLSDKKAWVLPSRVEQLRADLHGFIGSPANLHFVTKDMDIVGGSHRWTAYDEEMIVGRLNPYVPISLIYINEDLSAEEKSRLAIALNHTSNTGNKIAHLINSELTPSVKLFKPTLEAFQQIVERVDGGEFLEFFAVRLGSALNEKPTLLTELVSTGVAGLTAMDLYTTKNNGNTNIRDFISYDSKDVVVDLRKYKDAIATTFAPALELIRQMKESGLWKEKLGGNRMLGYWIFELAAQGRLAGEGTQTRGQRNNRISIKRFMEIVSESGRFVHKYAKQINADKETSKSAIDSLEKLFFKV